MLWSSWFRVTLLTFDECDVVTDESGTMGVVDVTAAAVVVDAVAGTAASLCAAAGTDDVDVVRAADTTGVADTGGTSIWCSAVAGVLLYCVA